MATAANTNPVAASASSKPDGTAPTADTATPREVSERPISWITPGKARGEAIPHIYQPRRGVSCGHDGTAEGRFNIHTAYGLGVPAERPYHRYDTKIPPHNRIAVEYPSAFIIQPTFDGSTAVGARVRRARRGQDTTTAGR